MRDAYGAALTDLVPRSGDIMVLDADNATSTRTNVVADRWPAQFLNVGIAEQNMVGIAAGLALDGRVVLANAFAAMLNRAFDQVVNSVCYQNLSVTLVGHYAGMSAGPEGAVHHSLFDLGLMAQLPGMRVEAPAFDDDVATCLDRAVFGAGPSYLRLARNPVGEAPDPDAGSLATGWRLWGPGDAPILILTHGATAAEALAAQAGLDECGITVDVLAVNQLAPVPDELAVRLLGRELLVTAEEHASRSGLGGVVRRIAPRSCQEVSLGVDGVFTESGSWAELQAKFGVHRDVLAHQVKLHWSEE